ncbi:hypothetical protein SAMN04487969_11985 [Paenibacillus algorifonticola]|uniref:Uncharacterized protein n=1 Tax=Paenibacillus algorifonticola TaxID=684063 RepID=A0A1I2H2S7_9BACL|nr:pyocin knob domain-containing protein [Paenibacillus algorifonticola]SFF23287.1 hypothetical protein SAMN04487969_11985 [Paenibacillus algorifonticola]
MAKTDWGMNDIVQPSDLNQLGQEINENTIKTQSTSGGNLDTFKNNGTFYVNNPANGPIANFYGYLQVINIGADSHVMQLVHSLSNPPRMWMRRCTVGTWWPWEEVARMSTMQNLGYGVTAGTSIAYLATIASVTALIDGLRITVKLHVTNGANPTINVNGLGARAIIKPNGSAPSAGYLKATVYTLVLSGTNFILQGEGGEYGTAVAAEVVAGKTIGTETGLVAGTMPLRGGEEYAGWVRAEMGPTGPTTGRLHLRSPLGAYLNGGGNGAGYMGIFADDPDFIAANVRQGVDMFGLLGAMPVGYTIVAGTVTNGSISTSNRFPSYEGGSDGGYIVEITGHNVTPRIVLLMNNAFYGGYTLYCEELSPDTIVGYPIRSRQTNTTRTDFSRHANPSDFTSSYICLPSWSPDTTFKYIIIGQ